MLGFTRSGLGTPPADDVPARSHRPGSSLSDPTAEERTIAERFRGDQSIGEIIVTGRRDLSWRPGNERDDEFALADITSASPNN
jgi:hypothetical protein